MTSESKEAFIGRLLPALLVVGAVIGSAFWMDDRVEAKIRDRLCPIEAKAERVQEVEKTLIRIETRLASIEELIDYQRRRENNAEPERKGDRRK